MIPVLFAGGTIGMRHDAAAGGAVPTLSGQDILRATRGVEEVAELAPEEWGAFPGPHMTSERQWALRGRVAELLKRDDVDAVVVAHGTDTLEETAYLMARSLPPTKPVVVTGAMRSGSELGWDGPANMLDSVRVAASQESVGYGTLVVIGGRIISALEATKADTHAMDAFESPGLGPVGTVDDGRVIFRREAGTMPEPLLPSTLGTPVDIVMAWAGADARLLDASRLDGLGVVVAALGRGNIPPAMAEGVARWIESDKPVVIASRAPHGLVGPTYGYPGGGRRLMEMGAILAGSRRPQQARLELLLALGAGLDLTAIGALFAR